MELHASKFALMRIVAMHAAFRLLEKHGSGTPPPPAPLDLYRELQAVTPDSLQYVLDDLFATNTLFATNPLFAPKNIKEVKN